MPVQWVTLQRDPKLRLQMSMHHVLSVVCFSAGEAPCGLRLLHHLHLHLLHHHRTPGLIFDRAHFYAAFDGALRDVDRLPQHPLLPQDRRAEGHVAEDRGGVGLGLWCAPRRHGARLPSTTQLSSHTAHPLQARLVFFRLILFPAWLYMFISDMRNHPEQTWDLMNGI